MTTPDAPSGPARLADRLAAASLFVGRAAELALFAQALAAATPPFAMLFLHGPGGVGKSSLLQQFARLATAAGRRVALLDSRDLDPSPQGFTLALGQALGLAEGDDVEAALGRSSGLVLLIDTYERLTPLDSWLRERLLPSLPAASLVAIAGRNPPGAAWRAHPAWAALLRALPLRNLRPAESAAFLARRGVAAERQPAALDFTHGHPLALSLVADQLAQGGELAFRPEHAPDIVALLLERFVQDVPSPRHRLALHACAEARVLTEALLRDALAVPEAGELFAWLRTLSFVEQGPFGLFPHDLARELLERDLRWRDLEGYHELHRRLRVGIVRRIQATQGTEQLRAVFDLVYLHRTSPILQPYFAWQSFGTLYAEPARPEDRAPMLQQIATFADEEAAALAEHWLERQPEAWQIIRTAEGRIAGVFAYLHLERTTPAERARDPAAAYAWAHIQRYGPLRPGDEATLARYFFDPAISTQPTPAVNTAQLATAQRWMSNPRLAWSFTDLFAPEHWFAMMSYYAFHRLPDRSFGLYGHNWRATPVEEWITRVGERELQRELRVEELVAEAEAPLIALSQPEFEEAVRAALRDLGSPAALAANQLLRSRVLRDHADGAPSPAALRALIELGVAALQAHPREAKFFRALEATYLRPVATQELAAERLGLPFGTYRYQLAQGTARLTAWLWQRELYGPPC